jgi:orotidine-5'-phosphate decarboxylase
MSVGLIVALDKVWEHFDGDSIENFLWSLKDVTGFKMTAAGFLNGLVDLAVPFIGAMERAHNKKYEFLSDFKIADVGVKDKEGNQVGTNKEIIEEIVARCPLTSHITVHGFPGPESVHECVQTAGSYGVNILLLSSMTHAGSKRFMPYPDYMNEMIVLSEECQTYGFIAPGNDYDFIDELRKQSPKPVWCPGFGRQATLRGGEKIGIGEQIKRWKLVADSLNKEAVENRIIVGSYIVNAEDPEEKVAEVLSYLNG